MTASNAKSITQLVAGLDPQAARAPVELDARARADLATILIELPPPLPEPRARRPAVRQRWALVFPVAAALAVLLVLVWPAVGPGSEGAALAATPAPLAYQPLPTGSDPRVLLTQIADRTALLPDDTGTGRYAQLSSRGWDLFTDVDGHRITSKVVPQLTESWTAADGSGRTVTTVEEPGKRPRRDEQRYRPGGLPGDQDLRDLPADEQLLAAALESNHPVENGPAERLVAIKDTYRSVPVPPAVRAALLRYLADTPTLTTTGTVTDRAGRPGVAFSLDSDYSGLPTRYTLIIDPDTGKLLAGEDTLTTNAGALNVPVPAVIGYTTNLTAHYTDNLK